MPIRVDRFSGIQPKVHPSLLQDAMAQTAHNVKLDNGKIVPLRMPSIVDGVAILMENGLADIADAYTMHVWKKYDGDPEVVLFPGMTWMAPGNIADDDRTRVIVSGDTGEGRGTPLVYMRDGNSVVRHPICKNPPDKPSCRRNGGVIEKFDAITMKGWLTCAELNAKASAAVKPAKGDTYYASDAGTVGSGSSEINPASGDQVVWLGSAWGFYDSAAFANLRYTYFFATWVDEYGYESPVSEPSDEITYNDGDTITFDGIGGVPDDADLVRIYKVVTGTETGRIQFVAEFKADAARESFAVTVKDEDAGEVLTEIVSPPEDLRCIQEVPGDFYCGFSPSRPKTVMFSDVGLLYSWPDGYRYDIADNVVCLAVTSNTVFVMTDGWPYVISGTAPDGMSVTKLAGPSACVSPRSVCVYRNAVYFASNEGLMTIYNSANAGTVCENLTLNIFTKDQWQKFNPSSCICAQHDGALHLFFTDLSGRHHGLRIGIADGTSAVTTHDEVAKCACVENKGDRMFFVREVSN